MFCVASCFQATPYNPYLPGGGAYQPAAIAGQPAAGNQQRGNYDQYHAYLNKLQQDRNGRERGAPATPFGKPLVWLSCAFLPVCRQCAMWSTVFPRQSAHSLEPLFGGNSFQWLLFSMRLVSSWTSMKSHFPEKHAWTYYRLKVLQAVVENSRKKVLKTYHS